MLYRYISGLSGPGWLSARRRPSPSHSAGLTHRRYGLRRIGVAMWAASPMTGGMCMFLLIWLVGTREGLGKRGNCGKDKGYLVRRRNDQ